MNSKDQLVRYALPGENVRIALHGIEENQLWKGRILIYKKLSKTDIRISNDF